MNLGCPVCGTYTVPIDGSVKMLQALSAEAAEDYLSGHCTSCGSRVLIAPTTDAVESARARLAAAKAVAASG